MLKYSITPRGRGLKQEDLWRFSGGSSHLLYVLQPLPLSAQSQQQHGILFHTTSSSVTQLDLKLFLFLRLHSVEAGALQLRRNTSNVIAPLCLQTLAQLLNEAWRIRSDRAVWVCSPACVFVHVLTVHFLCARAEHDEWAEWSVKAVFSLITLRCLIRARVCALSHRRSWSLVLWQPCFRGTTIIRQMWKTQSTSENGACCRKACLWFGNRPDQSLF